MTAAQTLDPSKSLTLREAAVFMHLGRSTIYRLIAAGELAAYQHAGRSWVTPTAINDYYARLAAAAEDRAAQRRAARAKTRRSRGSHARLS